MVCVLEGGGGVEGEREGKYLWRCRHNNNNNNNNHNNSSSSSRPVISSTGRLLSCALPIALREAANFSGPAKMSSSRLVMPPSLTSICADKGRERGGGGRGGRRGVEWGD